MTTSGRLTKAVLAALLATVTCLVYAPLGTHPFLHYDDHIYVSENPTVQAGLTREGVIWAFTTSRAANWHPLTWLSHMLDCQLFGVDPGRHHLVSAAIHAATAAITFLLFVSMTGAFWRSAFVAAVFALHPLHVESVAWISERKDVLSGLFWMLTIAAYLHYARRPSAARYLLVLVAFVAGLLCKPMLVTMPLVLLLLDVWPLRRLRVPWIESGRNDAPAGRRVWLDKIPLLLLSAASSVVTYLVQRSGGAMPTLEKIPIWERVGNAAIAYLVYVKKTVWPSSLAIFYPRQMDPVWGVLLALLALIAATAVVLLLARRKPYLAVGWLWFVGTLVPTMGLVQVGMQSMADRYMYIPMVGLAIMVAWGVPDRIAGRRGSVPVLAVGAAAALIAMTLITRQQIAYWRDERALFQHALDVTRDNFVAHANLGVALHLEGNVDEALTHYRAAERLQPNRDAVLQYNLGLAHAQKGLSDSAEVHLREALRLRPNYLDARTNLGILLAMQGRLPEGEAQFREALRETPADAVATYNLGLALAAQGRRSEAIAKYEEALRLKPDYSEARAALESELQWKGMAK